jgi:hypothetical protein
MLRITASVAGTDGCSICRNLPRPMLATASRGPHAAASAAANAGGSERKTRAGYTTQLASPAATPSRIRRSACDRPSPLTSFLLDGSRSRAGSP